MIAGDDGYFRELALQLAEVEQCWSELMETWEETNLQSLTRQLHLFAALTASHQQREISDACRYTAVLMRQLGHKNKPGPFKLAEAEQAMERIRTSTAAELEHQEPTPPPDRQESAHPVYIRPVVLLIDQGDTLHSFDFESRLRKSGFAPIFCTKTIELPAALSHRHTEAMVLDLDLLEETDLDIIRTVTRLKKEEKIPVICVSEQIDLEARLKALRAGCSYFISRPVKVHDLVLRLKQCISDSRIPVINILIVDDDEFSSEAYRQVLTAYGMNVTLVNNPLETIQVLEVFRPDMILMDLYMPACSGQELTAVIRQDEALMTIPILYLSAETDPLKQLSALDAGADGFLVKNAPGEQLVSVIRHQVMRWRKREEISRLHDLAAHLEQERLTEQLDQLNNELDSIQQVFRSGELEKGTHLLCGCGSRFEVLGPLSRGKVNMTYLARRTSDDQMAVIKMIRPEEAHDNVLFRRFVNESRTVMRMNHPYIVKGLAYHKGKNFAYLAMEFIDGVSLRELLQQDGVFEPLRATEIMLDAARALVYLESQKMVHRDLKPSNLIIDPDGDLKLVDFGLAIEMTPGRRASGSMEIMGTPYYISPEQLKGKEVDTRADIYALGGTYFHLVTGIPPFRGKNVQEVLKAHALGPVSFDQVEVPVPETVKAIIQKMTEPDPDRRPATARKLELELEEVQESLEILQLKGAGQDLI